MFEHFRLLGKIFKPLRYPILILSAIGGILLFIYDRLLPEDQKSYFREWVVIQLSYYWVFISIITLLSVVLYIYFRCSQIILPRAKITFDDSGYYRRTEMSPENLAVETVLVGMENNGSDVLKDCSVRIEEIVSHSGVRPINCPVSLQRMEGRGTFPLRPGGHRKLAFVASNNIKDKKGLIYLRVTSNIDDGYKHVWEGIPRDRYYLRIGLSPMSHVYTEKEFELFIDSNNRLQFRPLARKLKLSGQR